MKKLIRTLQTRFPMFHETKFFVMRSLRRMLKKPFESDFVAIRHFSNLDRALFLDVSGNRGQSTDAILLYAESALIQIFEPVKVLGDRLEHQFRKKQQVEVNKFALGDRPCEQQIYIPYYRKWMFDGLASLDMENPRLWLKENLYNFKESFFSLQEDTCEVRILDQLDLKPFFIKLDIQGYEYQALKGGEKTIRANEPVLLIEAPDQRIIDYLSDLGYQYYAFDNGKFRAGETGSLNTFFMTKTKASDIEENIVQTRVESPDLLGI